jgi:molecular chaperone DnaK
MPPAPPPPVAAPAPPPPGWPSTNAWSPPASADPFSPPSGSFSAQPDPFAAALPAGPSQHAPRMPSAAPSPHDLPMSGNAPPLLLDVTPLSLGVETVGGYCETVIRRNAAIPVEQTRIFSTATDGQVSVHVRIVQGESRSISENQALGEIQLAGLREAHRGQVKIGVTFVMDANGTLGVRAKDLETGREQQVLIQLLGALPEAEIRRMQDRQQRMV